MSYDAGMGKYPHIKKVVMSSSIEEIGSRAFKGCYDLKTVEWGSKLKTIDYSAFEECYNLSSIKLPSTMQKMESGAFYNCKKVSKIEYNAVHLQDLGYKNCAFYNIGKEVGKTTVSFGSTVKYIPANLFDSGDEAYDQGTGTYQRIGSITLPSSVTEVGERAFVNCFDMKTVTFNPNGGSGKNIVKSIKKNAKYGTLPTVKRKGYTCSGWYTKKSGGSKVYSSTVCKGTATLYAHWSKVSTAKASISKLKSGSKSYTVYIKKISGVKGYQLSYSTKSNMKNAVKLYCGTSKTVKKLQKRKKYYVQVRAYKLDSYGNKIFGKWSSIKNVKTK